MEYDVLDLAPPRRRRRNARERWDARAIVRRVDWLNGTLVAWQPKDPATPVLAGFKPLRALLVEALQGHAPGLYSVTITPRTGHPDPRARGRKLAPWINPVIRIDAQVSRSRLTLAGQALKRVAQFHQGLARLVDDPAAWRERMEARLARFGDALARLNRRRSVGDGPEFVARAPAPEVWNLRRWNLALTADINNLLCEFGETKLAASLAPLAVGIPELAAHCDGYERAAQAPLVQFMTMIRGTVSALRLRGISCRSLASFEFHLGRFPARLLPDGKDFHSHFGKTPSLRQLAQRFLGVRIKELELQELYAGTAGQQGFAPNDFVARLTGILQERLTERLRVHRATTFALIGRIIRFTGDPGLMQPYAKWLGRFDSHATPPRADQWTRKLTIITHLLAHSGAEPENVRHWFEHLSDPQWCTYLFRQMRRTRFVRDNSIWCLARLHDQPEIVREMLMCAPSIVEPVESVMRARPENLGPCARWLLRFGGDTLGGWEDKLWIEAFSRAPAGQVITFLNELMACFNLLKAYDCTTLMSLVSGCLNFMTQAPLAWAQFARRPWILRDLAKMIATAEQGYQPRPDRSRPTGAFRGLLEIVLIVADWEEHQLGNVRALVNLLLCHARQAYEQSVKNEARHPRDEWFGSIGTATRRELAEGKLDRYAKLLRYNRYLDPEVDLKPIWKFCRKLPVLHRFLAECLDDETMIARGLHVMRRMRLVLQFNERDFFRAAFAASENPDESVCPLLPAFIPPDMRDDLKTLAVLRCARDWAPWPKEVAKVVGRREQLRRELDHLEQVCQSASAFPGLRQRAARLQGYLESPRQMQAWILKDLRKLLRKHLPAAKLRFVDQIISRTIRRHWFTVLPGLDQKIEDPDWLNALRLFSSGSENRTALRRLLNAELKQRHDWRRNLDYNQRFIAEAAAAGVNVDAWLSPFSQSYEVAGDEWTVHTELDPVRILQMGNFFDTCLSVGDCNDYSTIANAIEADKRVLFIRNRKGHVIGRKLIGLALDEDGPYLIGFHSYGAGPWVQVHFHQICAEIARRIGAGITLEEDRLDRLSEQLGIQLQWYNDGVENWHWWTLNLASGDLESARETIIHQARQKTFESNRLALLWLGERALDAIDGRNACWLGGEDAKWLARHTESEAVRQWAANRFTRPK